MTHVKFNPSGSPLKIEITYLGNMTASYVYTLWENNSNAKADEKSGNNLNDIDDKYELPTPVKLNEGRIIELFTTLKNADSAVGKEIVAVKIFQGNNLLFTQENPGGSKAGNKKFTVTEEETVPAGKTILNDLFINLIV